ncbi:NINE protein [Haloferula sp.]|uniref:TM2 domain-containing protein n=1 Tax=Haloferula sp. TaxID=2497595 RepID=UPI0032A03C94
MSTEPDTPPSPEASGTPENAPNQTPAPQSPPPSGKSDKKLVAGLLGILLGSFGIHKFYLGYQTEGIIMLVVTLVVGGVTCGFGIGVMGLVGLIEGIIYLTKTDAEFEAMYVKGRKPWF